MTFLNIRAVIFDKDGTLADVEPYLRSLTLARSHLLNQHYPGVGASLKHAFGLVGDRLDPAGLMMVGTRQENEIAAATYLAEQGMPWFAAQAQVAQLFQDAEAQLPPKASQTPLLPDIHALLEHLRSHHLRLGIISSDSPHNIQAFLDCYHLADYFQSYVGAEPGQPTKPDPALVQQLCARWGIEPSEVLVVGDALGDIEMAIAAQTAGAIAATWAWPSKPPDLPGSTPLSDPQKMTVIP